MPDFERPRTWPAGTLCEDLLFQDGKDEFDRALTGCLAPCHACQPRQAPARQRR